MTFILESGMPQNNLSGLLISLQKIFSKNDKQGAWFPIADGIINLLTPLVSNFITRSPLSPIESNRLPLSVSGSKDLISRGIDLIKKGELLTIYPEGFFSINKNMGRFRNFAARVALKSRAPVIPCAILGLYGLSDLLKWIDEKNRSRSVIFRIGPAIQVGEFPETGRYETVRRLTSVMHENVEKLLHI